MKTNLPARTISDIRNLYRSNQYTYKELAARYGVTPQTVRNIVIERSAGYSTRKEEHPDERRIRSMHAEKRTPAEIAEELGYSTAAVSSYLRDQGLLPPLPAYVKPLPEWKPLPGMRCLEDTGLDEATLRRLHADELTTKEMAERTGFSRDRLSQMLRAAGLEPNKAAWGMRGFEKEMAERFPCDWRKANPLRFGKGVAK
jgi:DNA-binding CsgD family transcriptional regulator